MKPKVRSSFVVIGTSTGGIAALERIFKELPRDFPGAILVVLHVRDQGSVDWLADVLTRTGHLPVKVAEAGQVIRQRTAYLAPASTHLLVEGDHLALGTGAREQWAKPSIDVLFRSAASAFGQRVIGVILTGMMRDGTRGLREVQEAGGITIVQNPGKAEASEMPRNAMKNLAVDYCLDLADIGPVLDLLVRRAGRYKKGVLETGLASAVRTMKDRARLLRTLYAQSQANPKTAKFLHAEIAALEEELTTIQQLIPAPTSGRARPTTRAKQKASPHPRRGARTLALASTRGAG